MFEISRCTHSSEIGCKFSQTHILVLHWEVLQASVQNRSKKVNKTGGNHVNCLFYKNNFVLNLCKEDLKSGIKSLFCEIFQTVLDVHNR